MDKNSKKLKKLIDFTEDSGLAIFDELQEINEGLEGFNSVFGNVDLSKIEAIQGEKGDTGKDGKDGTQGIQGPNGPAGPQGREGYDGFDGRDGIQGLQGILGKDGKDGSSDTPEGIKYKLESLKGNNRLDASAIKNLPSIIGKIAKDGYPYGLPQPAGAMTYKLNGALVGRGNILNLTGSGITTTSLDDGITFNISGGGGGGGGAFTSITGTPNQVAYFDAAGNGTTDGFFTRNDITGETIIRANTAATTIRGIAIASSMFGANKVILANYDLADDYGSFISLNEAGQGMNFGSSDSAGFTGNFDVSFGGGLPTASVRLSNNSNAGSEFQARESNAFIQYFNGLVQYSADISNGKFEIYNSNSGSTPIRFLIQDRFTSKTYFDLNPVTGLLFAGNADTLYTVGSFGEGSRLYGIGGFSNSAVSSITFGGAGLNDIALPPRRYANFYGTLSTTYTITITSNGVVDVFGWSDNRGNSGGPVGISTDFSAPNVLSYGQAVYFGSDTGHTIGNSWSFTVVPENRTLLDIEGVRGIINIGSDANVVGNSFIRVDQYGSNDNTGIITVQTDKLNFKDSVGNVLGYSDKTDWVFGNHIIGGVSKVEFLNTTNKHLFTLAPIAGSEFTIKDTSGHEFFKLNPVARIIKIGDITGALSDTLISVDIQNESISLVTPSGGSGYVQSGGDGGHVFTGSYFQTSVAYNSFSGNILETSMTTLTYGTTHSYAANGLFGNVARLNFSGGTGTATVLLPTGINAVIGTRITIKDLDAISATSNIILNAGTGNTINGSTIAQTYPINSNGASVTLIKVTATKWSLE